MQALSQLSYTPNFDANYISRRRHHSLNYIQIFSGSANARELFASYQFQHRIH